MNQLDLLIENYFTESFETSDLLRLIEQVMNEDSEGQSGTAFEDVIVDVARRGFKKEETNAEGEITQYATGGKKGSKKYNPKPKNAPFKGQTFTQLAITCLKKMGYTEEQIKSGVDPKARKASGAGVSGDPKTDVIIDDKQISLKLPGDIQLSSGAAASTNDTISIAFEEWAALPQAQRTIENIKVEALEAELKELKREMALTTGKTYYPREKGTRGDWRKYVDDWEKEYGRSYEAQLAARAQGDWEKNKYPSGGIPSSWGDDPQEKFQSMNEYIKAFIELAKEKMKKSENPLNQEEPYEIYEEFKNNALIKIKEALKNLTLRSPSFYYILFDEWLTGRRAFEGEQVAEYLLSPWGFEEIKTKEQTKKLADAARPQVKADMRAKARDFLGKEMAVRIDFKADTYYKKKLANFYKKLKVTNPVSTQVPYLNEEEDEEESIQSLSKQMAKSLVIEI